MSINKITQGQYVSLTYSITDDQGSILEQNDLPVSFVYGSDTELIGGMDKELLGHQEGDQINFTVMPEDGYGIYDPELTFTDDIENVPPQFRQLGAEVKMQNEQGETKVFYVTNISDDKLTVDGNHPLAGKTLHVHVKIIEVRNALPGEEQTTGIHTEINKLH